MTRLTPATAPHETLVHFNTAVDSIFSGAKRKKDIKRPEIRKETSPEHQEKINSWKDILSRSETGKALLDAAMARGITIHADNTIKPLGYYSPSEGIIVVNPDRTDGEIVATLAHELRHAWQDERGFFPTPKMSPRDVILMLFAMEADAETSGVIVSHELAQEGFPDALVGHLGTGYGDISAKYMESVEADPENAKNGIATRAAYDQWFEQSWRRNGYGQQGLGIVVQNIKVFAAVFLTEGFMDMTREFLSGIGIQPNGSNYLTDTAENGESIVGPRYRKGLGAQIEMMLGAVDKAFEDLKKKMEGQTPGANEPDGESPDAPVDPDLEKTLRKFAGKTILSETPVNGLYMPIPSKPDKYREQRKGYVPSLTI